MGWERSRWERKGGDEENKVRLTVPYVWSRKSSIA